MALPCHVAVDLGGSCLGTDAEQAPEHLLCDGPLRTPSSHWRRGGLGGGDNWWTLPNRLAEQQILPHPWKLMQQAAIMQPSSASLHGVREMP